jgi:hypothetical protein
LFYYIFSVRVHFNYSLIYSYFKPQPIIIFLIPNPRDKYSKWYDKNKIRSFNRTKVYYVHSRINPAATCVVFQSQTKFSSLLFLWFAYGVHPLFGWWFLAHNTGRAHRPHQSTVTHTGRSTHSTLSTRDTSCIDHIHIKVSIVRHKLDRFRVTWHHTAVLCGCSPFRWCPVNYQRTSHHAMRPCRTRFSIAIYPWAKHPDCSLWLVRSRCISLLSDNWHQKGFITQIAS